MFTGLIADIGTVKRVDLEREERVIEITTALRSFESKYGMIYSLLYALRDAMTVIPLKRYFLVTFDSLLES